MPRVLPQITVPGTACGTTGPLIAVSMACASIFPGSVRASGSSNYSRLGTLPAGHFAWEEVPDLYGDLLVNWLGGGYKELFYPRGLPDSRLSADTRKARAGGAIS